MQALKTQKCARIRVVPVRQTAKLGNYHCNNRIYTIGHGRWLSPDQASSPSWNLFDYCAQRPLQQTDPVGLYATPVGSPFSDGNGWYCVYLYIDIDKEKDPLLYRTLDDKSGTLQSVFPTHVHSYTWYADDGWPNSNCGSNSWSTAISDGFELKFEKVGPVPEDYKSGEGEEVKKTTHTRFRARFCALLDFSGCDRDDPNIYLEIKLKVSVPKVSNPAEGAGKPPRNPIDALKDAADKVAKGTLKSEKEERSKTSGKGEAKGEKDGGTNYRKDKEGEDKTKVERK